MPIAVTGLLPIVMFPLFGLAPSRNVSDGYFQVKLKYLFVIGLI